MFSLRNEKSLNYPQYPLLSRALGITDFLNWLELFSFETQAICCYNHLVMTYVGHLEGRI